MKKLLKNLNKLEDYLINESELSLQDTCNIVGYMSNIRKQAINYTHSSKELKDRSVPTFEEWIKDNKHTEVYEEWLTGGFNYTIGTLYRKYKTETEKPLIT